MFLWEFFLSLARKCGNIFKYQAFFPKTFDFFADYRPERRFFPQTNPNIPNRPQPHCFGDSSNLLSQITGRIQCPQLRKLAFGLSPRFSARLRGASTPEGKFEIVPHSIANAIVQFGKNSKKPRIGIFGFTLSPAKWKRTLRKVGFRRMRAFGTDLTPFFRVGLDEFLVNII